jgi:ribonuclease P protein component
VVLPKASRLRTATDFSEVVRRGRRASRSLLTVHALPGAAGVPARAGLVVSKAVGNSVVRHRTSRRLRHLLLDRLAALPAGTRVVVRASAQSGSASSSALAGDLDAALGAALRPRTPR